MTENTTTATPSAEPAAGEGDRSERIWGRGIAGFVLGSAFFILSYTRADPDLWGHVRFGQLMRELGTIPRTDPYSYLATDWINHEWLTELAFGSAFDALGSAGLVLLKLVLAMMVFVIVYRKLVADGLDELRGGVGAMLVLILLAFGTGPVRPQLFTYLFFLCVLLVVRAADEGRLRWLWALPPIFALWVNFHGGFLAGLGILLLWGVGRLVAYSVEGRDAKAGLRASAPAWAALGGATAATLANPYGADLLAFVLRTATVPRPEITEWNPVELASVEGAFYLAFLIVVVWGVLGSRRKRSPALLLILGVTALLPMTAIRHVPLFGLAGAVLGGPHLASTFRRRSPAHDVAGGRRRRIGIFFGTAGLVAAAAAAPNLGCIRVGDGATEPFPEGPVALIEEAGFQGNLATFFNWGEYLIWHLGPDVQVSIDGRRETVYPDSIYRESREFLLGVSDWDAVLEKRPTDLALVPRGYPVFNLLRLKPGWELVRADSMSGLFAPSGSEQLRRLEEIIEAAEGEPAATRVTGACFP